MKVIGEMIIVKCCKVALRLETDQIVLAQCPDNFGMNGKCAEQFVWRKGRVEKEPNGAVKLGLA